VDLAGGGRSSDGGVAVGRPRQAEQLAQRGRLVGAAKRAACPERHRHLGDGAQIARRRRRAQPEAVGAELIPGDQLVGQICGRAGEARDDDGGALSTISIK
jgi:hypothetical protein